MQDGRIGFYNRAYLVSANGQGEVDAHYDKIELVPFGEYVPARAILGYFVNKIVEGFGDMIPGKEQTLFRVKGATLGILICYESIFPDLTRREVNEGADVLVNITNDAWYGESSAPYQVLAMAALRSVETKVPMVRVANTGISALIEPSGEITNRTPLFTRGTEIVNVSWRPGAHALHDGRRRVRGDLLHADGDRIDHGVAMAAPGNTRSRAGSIATGSGKRPAPLIRLTLHGIILRSPADAGLRCDFRCSAI